MENGSQSELLSPFSRLLSSLFTPSQLTIELASLMAGLSSLCPWRSNLLTTDCP